MRITELFDNGEFVVSAEVGPPKGIHIDGMVEEAKKYLAGVHFVNVTDNQSSVMRLGSLATCKVLKDAGLNPIFLPRSEPYCSGIRPAQRRHAGDRQHPLPHRRPHQAG